MKPANLPDDPDDAIVNLLICMTLSRISDAAVSPQQLPDYSTASQASCLVPEAGAPSCGVENSPGSAITTPNAPYHVGNPMDVVSGNKYQYELDY